MKRIISVLITLSLLLCLAACNAAEDGDDTRDTSASADMSAEQPDGTTERTVPESLKLGGVDISEYKIVYSQNPLASLYRSNRELVTQDTEYDKQTAEYLASLLKEYFGAELEVVRDGSAKSEREINIGRTNRGLAEQYTFSSDKEYIAELKNGRFELCGSTYSATYRAVDALLEHILSLNVTDAELENGFKKQGEANILVIGCIGDSLTNGSLPTGYTSSVDSAIRRDIVSYPAVLQRLMWKDCVVYNYGMGGRTMTENFNWEGSGNHAYNVCEQYTLCMQNAANIDLAIIMLGTNDANSYRLEQANKYIYTARFKNEFKSSCENIVNALKEKNSDMQILLANAPIAYSTNVKGNLDQYIRSYQQYTADELGLELIDFYTYTKENMVEADFPDKLHPSDEGYTSFAVGMSALIAPTVNEMLK